MAVDAFDRALEDFLGPTGATRATQGPDRLELVASYTPDGLRDMVRTAYSHLRSRGERHPSLARGGAAAAGGRGRAPGGRRARGAGRARRLADGQAAEKASATLGAASRSSSGWWTTRLAAPAQLKELELKKGNAKALATARLRRVPRGARRLPGPLPRLRAGPQPRPAARAARAVRTPLREAKQARSALDFEDLELLARDLLDRRRGAARAVLVALRARDGRRVPGREPAPERAARAGRARQPLPRRGREPVDLRLPPRRRERLPRAPRGGGRARAGR